MLGSPRRFACVSVFIEILLEPSILRNEKLFKFKQLILQYYVRTYNKNSKKVSLKITACFWLQIIRFKIQTLTRIWPTWCANPSYFFRTPRCQQVGTAAAPPRRGPCQWVWCRRKGTALRRVLRTCPRSKRWWISRGTAGRGPWPRSPSPGLPVGEKIFLRISSSLAEIDWLAHFQNIVFIWLIGTFYHWCFNHWISELEI